MNRTWRNEGSGTRFMNNSAQDGDGGALSAPYSPALAPGHVEIDRAAFNRNSAALGGGAIATGCQRLTLRNVCLSSNRVIGGTGRGTAIVSSGDTLLVHATSAGHADSQPTFARTVHTFCGSQPFAFANSAIGSSDSCVSPFGGPIGRHGGNLLGPGASQCQAMPGGVDQRHSDSGAFGPSVGT